MDGGDCGVRDGDCAYGGSLVSNPLQPPPINDRISLKAYPSPAAVKADPSPAMRVRVRVRVRVSYKSCPCAGSRETPLRMSSEPEGTNQPNMTVVNLMMAVGHKVPE
jgi:hypothetical protein